MTLKKYTFIVEQQDTFRSEIEMLGRNETEARTKLGVDLEDTPLDQRSNTLESTLVSIRRKRAPNKKPYKRKSA